MKWIGSLIDSVRPTHRFLTLQLIRSLLVIGMHAKNENAATQCLLKQFNILKHIIKSDPFNSALTCLLDYWI